LILPLGATAARELCAASAATASTGGALGLPVALGLLSALAAAALLTPLARRAALRVGAVDRPGARSVHRRPIPYFGGLGIFAAVAVGLGILWLTDHAALAADARPLGGVLLGGLLVLLLGVADDCGPFWAPRLPWLADAEGRGLRPAAKLAGQVAAALVLCAFGVRIPDIHRPFAGNPCAYLFFSPVAQYGLTVLWVVAITNAVNLIDGLDGLAAGVSAISAATLLVVALLNPQMWLAALIAAVLLGACLGFLPYNFHPARIFMGDAGALFLGFTLGAVSLIEPLKSPTVITLAIPILVLGVPVFDTAMAILRRWRQGRLVGTADRAHVHHRLLDFGLSHRDAVLTLYAVSGWLGVGALAALNLRAHLYALGQALISGLPLPLLVGFGTALLTALVLTPAARALALRLGALDPPRPGHPHASPVPYLGGLALFAGVAAGLGALLLLRGPLQSADAEHYRGLLLGGLVVLGLGLADDLGAFWAPRLPWLADAERRGLRPAAKLAGQVVAAALLCAHGVRIPDIHMPFAHNAALYVRFSPVAQYGLTMLWVVAITNAVNWIDGLDGLAAGVAAISAATLLLAAVLDSAMWPAALAAAVLLGSCLGFLPFNFHPARIIMGDAGALFLGFTLSAVSVVGPLKGATVVTLAVPVLALGVPLFDVLLAVLRRWRAGVLPGSRDLAHVHHRLLDLGFSERRSVLLLYALSICLGIGALAVQGLTPLVGLVIVLFFAATGLLGARLAARLGPARPAARAESSLRA